MGTPCRGASRSSAESRRLARDNAIGKSTAVGYLHEGIDVLAAQAPSLHSVLLAAKAVGYSHVIIDGTLIETGLLH